MKRPNSTAEIITDRFTSFPVEEKPGAGGLEQPAGSGVKAPWYYMTELEQAGTHFFCKACLGHKPLDDRSPDARYCQWCCDFLLKEAEALSSKMRPAWIPKIGAKKVLPIPQDIPLIMTTVKHKIFEVEIIRPPANLKRRGPKHRDLPEELIRELADQGNRSKAIASILKDKGVTVSYKTIQRILNGQRVMI